MMIKFPFLFATNYNHYYFTLPGVSQIQGCGTGFFIGGGGGLALFYFYLAAFCLGYFFSWRRDLMMESGISLKKCGYLKHVGKFHFPEQNKKHTRWKLFCVQHKAYFMSFFTHFYCLFLWVTRFSIPLAVSLPACRGPPKCNIQPLTLAVLLRWMEEV